MKFSPRYQLNIRLDSILNFVPYVYYEKKYESTSYDKDGRYKSRWYGYFKFSWLFFTVISTFPVTKWKWK